MADAEPLPCCRGEGECQAPPDIGPCDPLPSAENDAPPVPFTRYERTVREARDVAEVTAENVGQIAALVGGQVDYSTGEPVLIVPGEPKPWRVKVGWHVSLNGDRLMNQNGFNRDGDWCPIPPGGDQS